MSNINQPVYAFERLDVYRVAYCGLECILRYRDQLKGLPGEIAGQMQRDAVRTVANITEGVGRDGDKDRKHRFAIARAEANETGEMVEIAALFGIFSDADYRQIRSCYLRVTYMLTALMP